MINRPSQPISSQPVILALADYDSGPQGSLIDGETVFLHRWTQDVSPTILCRSSRKSKMVATGRAAAGSR